jgi:hypothetical protein
VQSSANDQLTHIRSGGDLLEIGYERGSILGLEADRHAGEGVQAVRVNPEIRVAHPYRTPSGVSQRLEGGRDLTARCVKQTDRSRRKGLPARIADAASQRKGTMQQLFRLLELAVHQCHLAPQRLWQRPEGYPAILLCQVQ